jgi:hypothetical protein
MFCGHGLSARQESDRGCKHEASRGECEAVFGMSSLVCVDVCLSSCVDVCVLMCVCLSSCGGVCWPGSVRSEGSEGVRA